VDGLILRAVSDSITEVDGKPVPKGEEAKVRPGSTVKLARVMTLTFVAAEVDSGDNGEHTIMTP
jgi:hypothetical protein